MSSPRASAPGLRLLCFALVAGGFGFTGYVLGVQVLPDLRPALAQLGPWKLVPPFLALVVTPVVAGLLALTPEMLA